MSDTLGIIGFYFIFTRIDSWYSGVLSKQGVLSSYTNQTRREEYLKLQEEFLAARSSAPRASFALVGIFVSVLALMGIVAGLTLSPVDSATINPIFFLYLPLVATVLAYWAGGLFLLFKGSQVTDAALARIADAIK
jgi:hypothetical protein